MSVRQRVRAGILRSARIGVCVLASGVLLESRALAQAAPQADSADAAGGAATGGIDELVIQAEAYRQKIELVRDVPKSETLVGEEDLQKFDAVNLTDVLRRLGNVRFNFGNARTGSFSLRGLSAGPGNDKIDPSIGFTVDGVSYAYLALAQQSDFIDVEYINVTRGPQGTLGAKTTSVGQINVLTRKPTFTPEASGSITLGQLNALRTQAVLGGPVIDDLLAWRVSFERNSQDGAFQNQYGDQRGRSSYSDTNRTYGRLQFLLTPAEDFTARALFDIQPKSGEYINGLTFRKDTPDFYSNGDRVDKTNDPVAKLSRRYFTAQNAYNPADYYAYPVYADNAGSIIVSTRGALLDLTWSPGRNTLSLLSSWRDHYFSASNDEGTPFDITKNGGFITTYWQLSEELKLTSDTGSFFDYTAGIHYLKNKYDSLSRTRYGSDAGPYNASVAQYSTLDSNTAGRALMKDSLDRVYRATQTYLDNDSTGIYGQIDWHLQDTLTLTTGLRGTREHRRTSESVLVLDNGFGAALNPVAINNVPLGGFNSTSGGELAAGNTVAQLNLADAVARTYFGVLPTSVPGAAYNSLTGGPNSQKAQVAAAKAIRTQQFGTLYALADATPYRGDLLTSQLSLTKDFNEQVTGYVTWQRGEKAGISQFNGANANGGISVPVKPETSNDYELGVRTSLLDRTLLLNADVYVADFRNYQQSVYYYDEPATLLANDSVARYSSGVGNVAKVRSKGLELDLVYTGLPNTSVRFSGAYTDARYVDHKFSGQPSESTNLAAASNNPLLRFRDVSGFTLNNAPKVQFAATVDYRVPVFSDKLFHVSANYTYSGSENLDAALSTYGERSGYGIADLSIGLGRQDGSYDVNFLAKNLLDEEFGDIGWNTITVNNRPRWFGVIVSARLF